MTTPPNRNTAGLTRVGLVFTAPHDPNRHGEPTNAEPHKCAKIGWFPTASLPSNTYPYTVAGVRAWRTDTRLQLSGWH